MSSILNLIFLMTLLTSSAFSQVNTQLRYEGYLELSGNPVNLPGQTFTVAVKIPACMSTLGLPVWSSAGMTDIVNGNFVLQPSFPAAAFSSAINPANNATFGCSATDVRVLEIIWNGETFVVELADAARANFAATSANSLAIGGVNIMPTLTCSSNQLLKFVSVNSRFECQPLVATDIPALVAAQIPALVGDVTGLIDSTVVQRIQTTPVSSATPTTNQVLKFNGTTWSPSADNDGSALSLSGDLSGSPVSAQVVGLRSRPISTTFPATGSVLRFDGTSWTPASTLPVGSGGTGVTSFTSNRLVSAGPSGNNLQSFGCSAGQVLEFNGTGEPICSGTNGPTQLGRFSSDGSFVVPSGGLRSSYMPGSLSTSVTPNLFYFTATPIVSGQTFKNLMLEYYLAGTAPVADSIVLHLKNDNNTSAFVSKSAGLVVESNASGSSGTIAEGRGVEAALTAYGGQITNAIGVQSSVQNSTGTIITGTAFEAAVNGNMTTAYGLRIGTFTGAITNKWGIHQSDVTLRNFFNGNVGIGVSNPTVKLDVTDTNTATSAIIVPRAAAFTGTPVNGMVRYNSASNLFEFRQNGSWVNYTLVSDGRLKTNVEPLTNGLNIVNQLNPVFYDWDKSNPRTASFENKHQVGFIAQEVEKVIPEVVNHGEDGYRSIEYGKMIAIVVDAIKSLHKRIIDIEDRQTTISNAVASVKADTASKAKTETALAEKDIKIKQLERQNTVLKARLDQHETEIAEIRKKLGF